MALPAANFVGQAARYGRKNAIIGDAMKQSVARTKLVTAASEVPLHHTLQTNNSPQLKSGNNYLGLLERGPAKISDLPKSVRNQPIKDNEPFRQQLIEEYNN